MEINGDMGTRSSIPARPAGTQVQGQPAGRMPATASPTAPVAPMPMPRPGALLPPARSLGPQSVGRMAIAPGTPPGQLSPPRGGSRFGTMVPQGAQAGGSAQTEQDQNKHDIVMKYIDGARG